MEVLLEIWDYCQLSIYIMHSHYSILEKLIRMREDTNFGTQQAGHSDTTKKWIYEVSAGYLGKLPENLVRPYVNASTKWQVLIKVPDRGFSISMQKLNNY